MDINADIWQILPALASKLTDQCLAHICSSTNASEEIKLDVQATLGLLV